MNKFLCVMVWAFMGIIPLKAQKEKTDISLYERVSRIEKRTNRFNLYLNLQGGFNGYFDAGFTDSKFHFRDIRISANGNINEWLSYAYRQRLNRSNHSGANPDNLPNSLDVAGIGLRLGERLNMFVGKHSAAYGGIEYDMYPHEVYEFSDMGDYITCFMTGLKLAWDIDAAHQFQFQIMNASDRSHEATYGPVPGIEPAKAHFVYTLNWNGGFEFSGARIYTRWSVSLLNEAKSHKMYYIALGNGLKSEKWDVYFDALYSKEDIDRKGIMSEILSKHYETNGDRLREGNMLNAGYLSFIAKVNYSITDNWKIFTKAMFETASVAEKWSASKAENVNSFVDIEKGKYRNSYGYIGGVEYYPMENSNLHFFLNYIGRSYKYTDKAATLPDMNKHRICLGFVYTLPIY